MFKEILGDAFPVIEKYAPMIANVLGSPAAGSVTVLVMQILANAFGISPTHVQQLSEEIVKNPESESILQTLNDQYGDAFLSAFSKIPMPSSITVTLKVDWAGCAP